jgi:phosphoglycolate phosphatase
MYATTSVHTEPVEVPEPLQRPIGDIRAAIIDLDGTMVDTAGDFEAALNAALAEFGPWRIDTAFVQRSVGKGSEHLMRCALRETAAPASLFEALLARYLHHYGRVNGQHSQLYPGVPDGVAALAARGWPMACVTNKPSAFAAPLLEQLGLRKFFAAVYGGDAFERKKPDPQPLLKACEAMAMAPQHTLVIGDSASDAQAARAAGCPVLLVRYGWNHGEPVEAVDADGFIDSFADITEWLEAASA